MTAMDRMLNDLASVSADDILASHFTLKNQPGSIDHLDLVGASGWTSPHPHPVLSLGRWITSDKNVAIEALDVVLERCRTMGHGFDWMSGPQDRENGLTPLLEERGFLPPPLNIAAMAKPLSPNRTPTSETPNFVWRCDDPEDARAWRIMSDGFDVPHDVGKVLHDAYVTRSPMQHSDVYFAAPGKNDPPAGVGYLSYIGDGPAVLLRVSATLENARGQGLYRDMVEHRLQDAAENGRQLAYVHAYSSGSKRVLRAMGFEEIGTLQLHRWRP